METSHRSNISYETSCLFLSSNISTQNFDLFTSNIRWIIDQLRPRVLSADFNSKDFDGKIGSLPHKNLFLSISLFESTFPKSFNFKSLESPHHNTVSGI